MTEYGFRNRLGLLIGPILFAGIMFMPPTMVRGDSKMVAALAALMACWWICESLPLPATALIPLVAFPLMKIVPAGEVAASYASSSIFLFMGGFFIAVAMRKCNLHRRIALGIISWMGLKGDRVILGFMIATAFLSMWISNTATTMMMLPIALAVLVTLGEKRGNHFSGSGKEMGFHLEGEGEYDDKESSQEPSVKNSVRHKPVKGSNSTGDRVMMGQRRSMDNFKMILMLSIAYAANIGGIGTLIGTPPNVVFASQIHSLFPRAEEISFVKWMMVGLPLVVVFLPLTWLILTRFFANGSSEFFVGKEVMEEHRKKLGPMSAGERRTALVFVLTVLAWVTRADIDVGAFTFRGWASVTSLGEYIHDSTIAIAAGLALFVIPVNWREGRFILDWKCAREIPWGILILFGGGIALGKGFSESGLAAKMASTMKILGGSPMFVIVIITCLVVTFLTEITSNTAIATIFLPILGATAVGMGVHPFIMMIPATISASCAFMLPVATPPNAIVFSSGYVSVPGMLRIGVIMNFLGVALVTFLMYLLMIRLLGISVGELPDWVARNMTADGFFPELSGNLVSALISIF